MSQVTLALVTLSTWLQLLNLVVLHYDQLAACVAEGTAGWQACDHSLTTLAYIATSPLAAYATVLGVSCALAYIVMYLPQIIVSIQTQSAGSLSYGFLALHILLGVASAVQKAEGTHERIVTWAPPLMANVMQAVLIGLNLHYDARADRVAAAGEEAQPLGAKGAHDGYGATSGGDGMPTQKDAEQADGAPRAGHRLVLFSREWWERYL